MRAFAALLAPLMALLSSPPGAEVEPQRHGEQGARAFPQTAAEPFSVSDAQGKISLGVRLPSARPSRVERSGETARYQGALGPGTALLLRARPSGVEDVVEYEQRPANEAIDYLVDVRRVAGLRKVGQVVEFLDEGGAPRLRMEAPYIQGADGRVEQAEVSLGCGHDTSPAAPWGRAVVRPGADECRVTVSWAGRGVRYPAALDPVWTTTGALANGRQESILVELPGGKWLTAGGTRCDFTGCVGVQDCELFDPATQTWATTSPSKSTHRLGVTAPMIPGLGVVVIGGQDPGVVGGSPTDVGHKKTEVYEPVSGTWSDLPPMPRARALANSVTSDDGKKIYVFAGLPNQKSSATKAVDVFDSETKTWSSLGDLQQRRSYFTATALPGGKVLLAGGSDDESVNQPMSNAELYDVATGAGEVLPPMPTARLGHSANVIDYQGKKQVMLVGGISHKVDLFDPESKSWLSLPPMAESRALQSSVVLLDGSVLVLGGVNSSGSSVASVERFDPVFGVFRQAAPMAEVRGSPLVARLPDGGVLVAGGGKSYFFPSPSSAGSQVYRPLADGEPCAGPGDCASLVCADGVCCDKPCDGLCEACTAAKKGSGQDGSCAPIEATSDPDGECPAQEKSTCGRSGGCDGKGACALYPEGTACGLSSCIEGVSLSLQCSASQVCEKKSAPCDPFRCKDPTACASDCDSDEQCLPGAFCDLSKKICAVDLPAGAPCDRASACQSGFCVDGVCCDEACAGTCRACTQALKQDGGADGICGLARADSDPHDDCAISEKASCDQSGECDGAGKCALWPAGTECGAVSCGGTAQQARSTRYECDGAGACEVKDKECGLFICEANACLTQCQADDDCLASAYCAAGACAPRKAAESGQACAEDRECLDGFCVDGFCCNSPCRGACEACDSPSARGSCVPVSGAPHGKRPTCGVAPADNPCAQLACDGITRESCAGFADSSVVCRAPSCQQGKATAEAKCDGKGRCPEPEEYLCYPYSCSGGACSAQCKSDADCDLKFQCDTAAGKCNLRTTAVCDGDHTLVSPDGSKSDCAPYTCEGSACKAQCRSVLDCVLPSVCDEATRACVPPRPNPADEAGCQAAPGPAPRGASALLALAALLLRRRRSLLAASALLAWLPGCSGEQGRSEPEGPAPEGLASATLPQLASSPVQLAARGRDIAIGFRLAGALPAPRRPLAQGTQGAQGASYPGALGPGTTLRLRVDERSVEDVVEYEQRPANEAVDYLVDVRRVAGLRKVGQVVEFLDEGGAPRLRMEAPYIQGADGRVEQAEVSLGCGHDTSPAAPWGRAVVRPGADECRVTVSWAGRGVRYPAALDPVWSLGTSMAEGRKEGVSTMLPGGRMLFAGGKVCKPDCILSLGAELYDPKTDSWALTGPLNHPHMQAMGVLTPSLGFVAMAGDDFNDNGLPFAEHYNESSGKWQLLPPLSIGRELGAAVLLPGNKIVAVFGGVEIKGQPAVKTVELLDTTSSTWSLGGELLQGKGYHSVTVVPGNKVLVAGGVTCQSCGVDSATAELYDIETQTSEALPPMIKSHVAHFAGLIQVQGQPRVLIAGGANPSTELFDPVLHAWSAGPPMKEARLAPGSVVLDDGSVLFIGGAKFPPFAAHASVERFDPKTATVVNAGTLASSFALGAVGLLKDGSVIAAGGAENFPAKETTTRVQVYRPLAQGEPCAGPGECASLVCADGVCCDKPCDGLCEACTAAKKGSGQDGSCGLVQAGNDPDNECPAQEKITCGRSGGCDGKGACALYPEETPCGFVFCVKGVLNSSSCKEGACRPSESLCAPYLCQDATSCSTSCSADEQCAVESHCENNTCAPDLASGAPCDRASACQSGFCVDGVCCDEACAGACRACTQALKQDGGADGICGFARADSDPRDDCEASTAESCDQNGQCDGAGKCALWPAGTECKSPGCSGGPQEARSARYECDGAGACEAKEKGCGLFVCEASACLTQCQADDDCLASARCVGGACAARAKRGAPCAQGAECESGFCADGVCCNTACTGQCEACSEPGAAGSCIPVAGAPRKGRPACPAGDPQKPCEQRVCDGDNRLSCDGFVGSTVPCRAASCEGGVATTGASCNGKGQCPAAEPVPCEPFACRGNACAQGCQSDADCSEKFRCDTAKNECIPRTGAFCEEKTTLVNPDGSKTSCAPYACEGSACKTQCSSVLDCALPSVCDEATRACVPATPNTTDSAGCQAAPGPAPRAAAWLLLSLLLARRTRSRR